MNYLVFFALGEVDDALADAIRDRVRGVAGAGWFDDPGGDDRTTGGYVQVTAIDDEPARALLDAARDLSAAHDVVLEVQWREEVVGRVEAGAWTSA